MELRKIDHNSKDKNKIKEILIEAFPPEERPPYRILLRKAKLPIIDFCGIYDEERLVGMTYVLRGNGIAYLFLFAIEKEERGRGYGRQVLEIIKEKYKESRLFLALEQLDEKAENYQQRLSRYRFYESCGFKDMPYQLKEGSVIYSVMGIGGEVEPHEYKELLNSYLGPIGRLFVDTQFLDGR